jgi:hypothetical protein
MTDLVEIRGWFEAAKKRGSTHMIVVCDTYDHEDYPLGVYDTIRGDADCLRQYHAHQGVNMQRVMEVYDISLGWVTQSTGRVMNLPDPLRMERGRILSAKAAHGPV